ncbi:MAG TPA: elongation factor Ts [Candidatus Paceibacterota bacterium]|nr:elongation factor Ts [Candidatus Paceibacterota bacterium]
MATTEEIKQLRDATGVSVMQCKKALEEAGGDMEKAIVILRKIAAAGASKKSDRTLGAGIAAAYTHAGGQVVGAVVLACETDFVSRNPEFGKMAYEIAMHVAAMQPQFISREQVQDEDIRAAREVFQGEAESVKEDMRAKVVEGKLDSYLKDKVLLDQPFVKNGDITVREYIEAGIQKFGEKIEVVRMERLSVK